MKIISLFTGIGAFEKALTNIGIDYELVGFSEIDKYAIKSYCAIHNVSENKNLGDITKIDITALPQNIDLITHGSPCQDFSIAGKQAGAEKGSGTRSSLMWNTIDIVEHCKPKCVVWENVKNLLSVKHKHNFDSYIETMDKLGYTSYYKVLNAKDYGMPQNRERIYTISIRKDIDKGYIFPEKQELKLRLKDMLEDNVDEKYYLSDEQVNNIKASNFIQNQRRIQDKEYCDILCARDWKDPKCVQVGNLSGGKWDKINESCRRVYGEEGLSPTIHTCQGGNTEPKVMIKSATIDTCEGGWIQPSVMIKNATKDCKGGNSKGVVIGTYQYSKSESFMNGKDRFQKGKETSDTIQTSPKEGIVYNDLRIRKLSPMECWRLMGFEDSDFYKAQATGNSNSQLYKQAGNSIVVKVLEKIFENLFSEV